MNGEDLVYDWQHNVVEEPTEWAFNWEYYAEGVGRPCQRLASTTPRCGSS